MGCAGVRTPGFPAPGMGKFDYGRKWVRAFRISAEGLEGGHSGVEIHRQRANGIQLLARMLSALKEKVGKENLRLVFFSGGSVHNAIPNYAEAFIVLSRNNEKQAEDFVSGLQKSFRGEYAVSDPEITLQLKEVENGIIFEASGGKLPEKMCLRTGFLVETEEKLYRVLLRMPHGVHRVSDTIPGLLRPRTTLQPRTGKRSEDRIKPAQFCHVKAR